MKQIFTDKKDLARALVIILELFAVAIIVYLIILPFYPRIKYEISYNSESAKEEAKNLEKTKEKVQKIISEMKEQETDKAKNEENNDGENNNINNSNQVVIPTTGNRLIITKIGVNSPIIESDNENYGLSRGSWRLPDTSTPDKGGNTVVTGHRFKYLPPNNVTFYLLDKLEEGDIISVVWDDKEYYYKVKETKIVGKTETSILNKSEKPILTLFTCHPIYSEENRLVVVAELIN